MQSGSLSRCKQGVHSKRRSFLGDADVKLKLLPWLRLQKTEHLSIVHLLIYLQEDLVPSALGVTTVKVSPKTIVNNMHERGYSYRKATRICTTMATKEKMLWSIGKKGFSE